MIEYIKGELAEITPAMAVVDCNGVGYGINVSLNTYSAIQGKKEVKLFIYEAIREDAYVLYGFATKQERELFLMLITVSGIGGNTARTIFSARSPSELCNVISSGNEKLLKTVKGIGLKTAQRIIVELKDKIALMGGDTSVDSPMPAMTIHSEVHERSYRCTDYVGLCSGSFSKSGFGYIEGRAFGCSRTGYQTGFKAALNHMERTLSVSNKRLIILSEMIRRFYLSVRAF